MAMDVLHPPLIWVAGRCFRKYPEQQNTDGKAYDEGDDISNSYVPCVEEQCDQNFDIQTLENGRLRTTMKIPSAYFGNLIGFKGQVKKRIEAETGVHFFVPRFGTEGDVQITGSTKRDLSSARTRIEVIVDSARQKQPFTHFISIPLTAPVIKDAFADFRADVLRECDGTRGIESSIFQNSDKLHLTIGTMALLDENERQRAAKLLDECTDVVKSIVKGRPLVVQLCGIEYMNDDPAEVDVLYAKVQPVGDTSNRLQLVADHLVDRFVSENLMQRQYERVKLHATVMNTLFRKDNSGVNELNVRKGKTRESFDAVKILQLFENRKFGEILLDEVHVSQRHAQGKEGYYKCSAKMHLV